MFERLPKMFGNLSKEREMNERILLQAREDVLNGFKINLFLIMSDATPYAQPRETSIKILLSMKS